MNHRLTHTHSETLDLERQYTQKIGYKPAGVWYAFNNGWIDWCHQNNPAWLGANCFQLTFHEGRMLVLSTKAEVTRFLEEFGQKDGIKIMPGETTIDWNKVSQQYSGIEMRILAGIFGWDIRSGCVWDLSSLLSQRVFDDTGYRQDLNKS